MYITTLNAIAKSETEILFKSVIKENIIQIQCNNIPKRVCKKSVQIYSKNLLSFNSENTSYCNYQLALVVLNLLKIRFFIGIWDRVRTRCSPQSKVLQVDKHLTVMAKLIAVYRYAFCTDTIGCRRDP